MKQQLGKNRGHLIGLELTAGEAHCEGRGQVEQRSARGDCVTVGPLGHHLVLVDEDERLVVVHPPVENQ